MGTYLNHPTWGCNNKVNEVERVEGAKPLEQAPSWPPPEGRCFVCVVQNPWFEAAGVMVDKEELQRWKNPRDERPKTWFLMPVEQALKLTKDWR